MPDPGVRRESDARSEIEETRRIAAEQENRPIAIKDWKGRDLDPGDVVNMTDPTTGIHRPTFSPPSFTPAETQQAVDALRLSLEQNQSARPHLAQAIVNDPSKLWLMAEIQMMLDPNPSDEVSFEFTGELMESLTHVETEARNDYRQIIQTDETNATFWKEVAGKYGEDEKYFFLDAFAQLEEQATKRVAALGLAWADSHDMTDAENRAQLLFNIHSWAFTEYQTQLGSEGFLGKAGDILDAGQEFVEQQILNPVIDGITGALSSPEEAARRKNLTPGQKIAFRFGIKPPENAGDWGWWRLVSGATDAQIELGADPLNLLAGVGAGAKAVSTIPIAVKATKTARALTAARALLPKFFAGQSRAVTGGRVARVMYSMKAKSVDDLLDGALKNGVAAEALGLIKDVNPARFARRFPAWADMPDQMFDVIRNHVETPEEFMEVLKAGALNEVRNSGRTLDDLLRLNDEGWEAARSYLDDARPVIDEANVPTEFQVFHGTSVKHGDAIAEGGIQGGGLTKDLKIAETHAREAGGESASRVVMFDSRTLPTNWQKKLNETGEIGDIRQFGEISGLPKMRPEASWNIDSLDHRALVNNPNIPREVRLTAIKRQFALDAHNMKAGRPFVISDVPLKSKRVFNWDKIVRSEKLGAGIRRTAARVTPMRAGNSIDLYNTRKGSQQITQLLEHFGVKADTVDEVVGEYMALDFGARQDFIFQRVIPAIGENLKVPSFEYDLIQMYDSAGVRVFASSGADRYIRNGKSRSHPILPSQMAAEMPIPLDELNQVYKRANHIGNRSKVAKAFKLNGRGIIGSTRDKRARLVKTLRGQLGESAEGMTDDDLYAMAYSLVSPNTNMDGRGWMAATMMPRVGSVANKAHSWFTKAMLVTRPIQWMLRVAVLEEPIRAHLFNMPSLYSNPLQYMAGARASHYVKNMGKWADMNAEWATDVVRTLTRGADKNALLNNLDAFKLRKAVFPDGVDGLSLPQMKTQVARFVGDSIYSRTRVTKLAPVKRVPWAVKNRAHSIETAQNSLKKFGLPENFDFFRDAAEINQKLVSGYLGEVVGAADRKLYTWAPNMTQSEAFTHGQLWGQHLVRFNEDVYGNMAIRRAASAFRGEAPAAGDDAAAVVNSAQWGKMRHDLGLRFNTEGKDALSDLELANRYMDEVLIPEVEHLFAPFFKAVDEGAASADEVADMLEEFSRTHRLAGRIGVREVDFDLRGANYAGGTRDVGDFVALVKNDETIEIPSRLTEVSLDARFMAHDDRNFINKAMDWSMQTFGEEATQMLNRRPAFLHLHKRYKDQYQKIGIPAETAHTLATEEAMRMVNYVFFNMDEAPYYAAKLNQFLPFFGATYEVMAAWSYKMPVAVGGTWPIGVGEFARKFDRLTDALVNTGLVTREETDEGGVSLTLNLVPMDSSMASNNEVGRMLQGAGWQAVHTLDSAIATLLGMEEGLGLRSQGYRLAVGHPLNPQDFGILSFAQANIGLNPLTNLAVSGMAAMFPQATAPRRRVPLQGGETLADMAERLDMDVDEFVRYNRELFVDHEGFGSSELYTGLISGEVDPNAVNLTEDMVLSLPRSSLYDAFADIFMPFGEVNSPHEFALNHLPGALRWGLAGLALQNQPSDEFWKDSDMTGVFGGMLPPINEAQVASQLSEAFMYLEAHDLVNGKGPLARLLEKEAELVRLLDAGNAEAANDLRSEIADDNAAFLSRAQKVAAESLILRSLTGQMMPTAPGHVRLEQDLIRRYWDTREYADAIKAGEGGVGRVQNFKSIEDIEKYHEQVAAWLVDEGNADGAKAAFRKNYPQLMAYLTPKTFYKELPPDIGGYAEYQRQIEAGVREPAPLHVTMWRARSAAIQADYYNEYIARFGSDPLEAAANALNSRTEYQELQDKRSGEYAGLEMWDDMHGGVYANWRDENYEDTETWAQDQITDKLATIRANLGFLLELENGIESELDLDSIKNLQSSTRGAIAEISTAIRDYNELLDKQPNRNVYEDALNRYFEEVYIPYSTEVSDLFDRLPEVADSERQSVIYEQIKLLQNKHAGTSVILGDLDSTPFPNPLEYSWQGKSPEEQAVKLRQWLSRPVEWMNQDQALRIVEQAPGLASFVPTHDADFEAYREYTLTRLEIDEMFEAGEITRSQRTKTFKALEESFRNDLILAGRGDEVKFMDMTPYEKLELADMLPYSVKNMQLSGQGILGDAVRYYKSALEVSEESPGTVQGRQLLAPLYDAVEYRYFTDPQVRTDLLTLGVDLQDEDTLDNFLPWLFFGSTGER